MMPIMLAATHHRTATADEDLVTDISNTRLLRACNFKYLGVLFSPRNDPQFDPEMIPTSK